MVVKNFLCKLLKRVMWKLLLNNLESGDVAATCHAASLASDGH